MNELSEVTPSQQWAKENLDLPLWRPLPELRRKIEREVGRPSSAVEEKLIENAIVIPASELSAAYCEALAEKEASRIAEARLEFQRQIEEQQQKLQLAANMKKILEEQMQLKFLAQENFSYAIPHHAAAGTYVLPNRGVNAETGMRERPAVQSVPQTPYVSSASSGPTRGELGPTTPPQSAIPIGRGASSMSSRRSTAPGGLALVGTDSEIPGEHTAFPVTVYDGGAGGEVEDEENDLAELQVALSLKSAAVRSAREAAEFDADEALFDVTALSSDDSDGYDEDFEEEWRDETNDLYAACRAVECSASDDAAFTTLGQLLDSVEAAHVAFHGVEKALELSPFTPTEQSLLWNAVRFVYRQADPIHPKQWLSACSKVMERLDFLDRPSVTNWCYLLAKLLRLDPQSGQSTCRIFDSARRRRKLQRWQGRAVFLVRKRMIALREFGVEEPKWTQLNVSVNGCDRPAKVPFLSLQDTLNALTAFSAPLVKLRDH